ncbi:CDP-glycerol:glycerophosphate glycerophosphotransferase [Methanobrevibacter sp.]|uniref:CDP-glycerol:glycerophosphate glycerophosphotransferase n=1 Tax=Methanobrevibacter sp. TaxID=66852 RepID=UPI00388EEEB7
MAFKMAVVMPAYNTGKYISQALDSIIDQSLNFKKNIQIIIVNDNSQDDTKQIALEYQNKYPDNIKVINNETNKGPAYSRNLGLKYVDAEFVNFLDSDDYISKGAFKKAFKLLTENSNINIVSIPIEFFGVKIGNHPLNYKFEKTQVINIHKNPSFIQLSGPSSFFRFSELKFYKFNENLRVSEDPLLINQMLIDNPNIAFIHDETYFYRRNDLQNSLIATSTQNKSYFTTRVDEYFIKLIEYSLKKLQKVPKFIQHVLMYDLQWILEIKFVNALLNEEEINRLYDKLFYILSFIDDDIIRSQLSIPIELKEHIVLLKHNKRDYLVNKDSYQKDLDLNTVYIDNFEFIDKNHLHISGILTDFVKDTKIYAVANDEAFETEVLEYPQRLNYSLHFDYGYNHNFQVILPVNSNTVILFKTDSKVLIIDYNQTSRLTRTSKYKLSKDYLSIDCGDHIEVTDKTVLKGIKLEFEVLKLILNERKQGWRTGVILRILFFLNYYIFKRKHIWIFMDLPNAAGDNGYFLFKHANGFQEIKDIDKYYVFSKSPQVGVNLPEMEYRYMQSSKLSKIKKLLGFETANQEYKEINKVGKILPNKSLKHRLYLLFAEFILTSHPDNNIIYPFWGNYSHLSGLAKSKTVFLQHGVTKDNISHWLNNYDKRLDLIATVSDKERESFLSPDYGYSEDIVKVLGFPRFDYLEQLEDKKQIVFMPTWRRQYDSLKKEQFMQTSYFKSINDVLNDEELVNYIISKGYKLIFKPHRNLMKFLSTFDINPKIEIGDKVSYTDIFNHASLVISDFSSVIFDFAYLKKPVIYYQTEKNYHFNVDKAYFNYETMGFGPVKRTISDLEAEIINTIENDCKMDEIYQERVEDFFKFNDKNNCERVIKAVLELNDYY